MVGISNTALSQIEVGNVTPHKATLENICKALNVRVSVMLYLGITPYDVPEEKREVFKMLDKAMRDLLFSGIKNS